MSVLQTYLLNSMLFCNFNFNLSNLSIPYIFPEVQLNDVCVPCIKRIAESLFSGETSKLCSIVNRLYIHSISRRPERS